MRAVGACEQLEHAIREIDSVNLVLVKRKERNMVSVQFRCSNKCKHLEWRDASAEETRRRREHPRAARAAWAVPIAPLCWVCPWCMYIHVCERERACECVYNVRHHVWSGCRTCEQPIVRSCRCNTQFSCNKSLRSRTRASKATSTCPSFSFSPFFFSVKALMCVASCASIPCKEREILKRQCIMWPLAAPISGNYIRALLTWL